MKNATSILFSAAIVMRAIKVSLVVGTLLALINHYPKIMDWSFTAETVFQIMLTYFVPYAVSTYSSYQAIINMKDTDIKGGT